MTAGFDLALDGKAILVTGATSGLGRQFALALATVGAIPVVSGRRENRLIDLVNQISDAGGRAHALELDVTDIAAIEGAVERAWDFEGSLWGLVNNSGVAVTMPVEQTAETDYDYVMDTNVKGAFFTALAVGRRMIASTGGGRVVNIASIAAMKTLPHNAVYCISKAAVAHMTKSLAHEWARHGINVNAICPGYIKTEINAEFFDSPAGERHLKRFPRRRVGTDRDLNELLLYLLSPASAFVTGALMVADDGQSLA